MNYCLIFAGGVGNRMKSEKPKQFIEINDKPIIAYTVEIFNKSPIIDRIVIVTLSKYIKHVENIAKQYNFDKVCSVIAGGSTAMESQFNGLSYLMKIATTDDIVFIHAGVRPFINDGLLIDCLDSVKKNRSAITISPAIETTSILDSEGNIHDILPRQKCVLARAPQVFYLADIYDAHLKSRANHLEFIDSASLMIHFGHKLNVVEGPSENIKITTQYDLMLAKLWINNKYENN